MEIAIIIAIIFIIILLLIFMLKSSDNSNKTNEKPKVAPIIKGRSYPWFYVKECLFYFPISTSASYESETKQSLIDELVEMQKAGNFEKVVEICDQIIAKDYKYSKAWIDKINAIFNSALAGKEWNATVSKNILNCCYNYIKSFNNNYDKSINAKHSLIPVIIKRTQDMIKYNRETLSETYSFEIYNLLINLYYLMPYNELIDVVYSNLELAKELEEIKKNQYAVDTIKSLRSHVVMLSEKHKVKLDKEIFEEFKIANKTIVNDETFSTTWVGFDIKFPAGVNRVELIFKFYDQRRQEIDLSDGGNKRIVELFKANNSDDGYNIVIVGEDRIKYVTIEVYDETKKSQLLINGEENINQKEDNEIAKIEEKPTEDIIKNSEEKKINKIENPTKEIIKDVETKNHKIEENKETKQENKEEPVKDENNSKEIKEEDKKDNIEEDKKEKIEFKILPNFSDIKEIAMNETYCLFLTDDGKVSIIGNFEKNIDVKNWDNIEKIYATAYAAYAIRKDGTITVAGKNVYESWEYQYTWEDIQKLEPSYNHIVGLKNDGTVVASGDNTHGQCEVEQWSRIVDISASFHTVGLDKDGKVFAVGANKFGECDVDNWTNIEKIATGPFYTVGLREDGTVIAAGLNSCGQCNTNDWKDVKEIYVRGNVTVGLRYDGKVLVAGRNSYRFEDAKKWQDIKEVKIVNDRIIGITSDGRINYIGKPYWGRAEKDWNNISTIEANSTCILGKKQDGSLVCNKPLFGIYMPNNYENFVDIKEEMEADKIVVLGKDGKIDLYCINNFDLYKWDTSKFNNIKQISLSKTHLIGLKFDGTAVITGNDTSLTYGVESWKNLVKVSVGEKIAVGLTIDGRVVSTGNNMYGQCDTHSWLDIIDIAVYGSKVIGLKADGTVLATGYLEYDEEDFIKEAKNVVGVAVNSKQIMLLDSNGNVALSYNPFGEDKRSILEWRNITKIVANKDSFIGLKADKTLISTNIKEVEAWENISDIKASGEYVIGVIKIEK